MWRYHRRPPLDFLAAFCHAVPAVHQAVDRVKPVALALAVFALYDSWKADSKYNGAKGDGSTEGLGMSRFIGEDSAGCTSMSSWITARKARDLAVTAGRLRDSIPQPQVWR